MIDLAALLTNPARAADVPVAELAVVLAVVAAEQARLAAVQGALAARLAAAGNGTPKVMPSDELLDLHAARMLVRRSVSWMRHHGHTLPGFCQPQGKGTRVQWSRAALDAWMRGSSC
jgi:hypothetical protein